MPAASPQRAAFTFAREAKGGGGRESFRAGSAFQRAALSPRTRGDFEPWIRKIERVREDARGDAPFFPLLGGYFGFEVIRHWEDLPRLGAFPGWPDAELLFVRDVARTDPKGTWIATRSIDGDLSARAALKRLDAWEKRSERQAESRERTRARGSALPFRGEWGQAGFRKAFARVHRHIAEGDVFQCVLAERMSALLPRGGWDAAARSLFGGPPTPYQVAFASGRRRIVSASPECLVRVEGGVARTHPIAGTRPRGGTAAEDRKFERQMRESPKEMAEHVMLVDLGRNDLGRVALPGSVRVKEFARTQKLARVQHLVSVVEARLARGVSPWRALQSAFPAGTLSGAPKLRAIEILSSLEPSPRGPYGGAFVVADGRGSLDSCILIRSLFGDARGEAWVQAGAGIVYDSRADREYAEIEAKSRGLRELLARIGARPGVRGGA